MTEKKLKKIYPDLIDAWEKCDSNKNYQKIHRRLMLAVNILNKTRDVSGLNVLDIGCNNGLLSLVASQKFNKVVGIEQKNSIYKKALATKKVFKSQGFETNNVTFKNVSFKDYMSKTVNSNESNFIDDNINVILGCQVIYHLNDTEIDLLETALKHVKLVFFTSRSKGGNSNNSLNLVRKKNICKFLKNNGFLNLSIYNVGVRYEMIVGKK